MSPDPAPRRLPRRALLLLTLALSFCSIVYELALAQTLAATLGDTFLRYNVTIVLYLASLGLGALWCGSLPAGRDVERLAGFELALSAAGAAGPLAILGWDALLFRASAWAALDPAGWRIRLPLYAFDHGVIVVVGVLSGFELPLLMRLGASPAEIEQDRGRGDAPDARDSRQGRAPRAGGGIEVLAVDYGGTVLGALAFPLALLPGLGVLTTASLTALVNLYCGLWLALLLPRPRMGQLAAYAGVAAACLGLVSGREALHRAALHVFISPP